MDHGAKARSLPFMTASIRLNDLVDISWDDDTFIERAYHVWREIGNIATEVKMANVNVGADLTITLPQDCEFIKGLVSTDFQNSRNFDGSFGDYQTTPKGKMPEVRPDESTVSMESNVRSTTSTVPGESVAYKVYPGYLKVVSPMMAGQSAVLLYSCIEKDPDGLPYLNDPEVEAIALTLAKQELERRVFRGEQAALPALQIFGPKADIAMANAKSPEKLNDDDLDRLLDIKTSWGRKTHSSRYQFGD